MTAGLKIPKYLVLNTKQDKPVDLSAKGDVILPFVVAKSTTLYRSTVRAISPPSPHTDKSINTSPGNLSALKEVSRYVPVTA